MDSEANYLSIILEAQGYLVLALREAIFQTYGDNLTEEDYDLLVRSLNDTGYRPFGSNPRERIEAADFSFLAKLILLNPQAFQNEFSPDQLFKLKKLQFMRNDVWGHPNYTGKITQGFAAEAIGLMGDVIRPLSGLRNRDYCLDRIERLLAPLSGANAASTPNKEAKESKNDQPKIAQETSKKKLALDPALSQKKLANGLLATDYFFLLLVLGWAVVLPYSPNVTLKAWGLAIAIAVMVLLTVGIVTRIFLAQQKKKARIWFAPLAVVILVLMAFGFPLGGYGFTFLKIDGVPLDWYIGMTNSAAIVGGLDGIFGIAILLASDERKLNPYGFAKGILISNFSAVLLSSCIGVALSYADSYVPAKQGGMSVSLILLILIYFLSLLLFLRKCKKTQTQVPWIWTGVAFLTIDLLLSPLFGYFFVAFANQDWYEGMADASLILLLPLLIVSYCLLLGPKPTSPNKPKESTQSK